MENDGGGIFIKPADGSSTRKSVAIEPHSAKHRAETCSSPGLFHGERLPAKSVPD